MSFTRTQKVMFRHCDPAGIMFYPRYFELTNDTVEIFFAERLNLPFDRLHETASVPTARIEARFKAPCRLGEVLIIEMTGRRMGRSSLDLGFAAWCEDQERFTAEATLVHVDTSGRPAAWPPTLRARIAAELGIE